MTRRLRALRATGLLLVLLTGGGGPAYAIGHSAYAAEPAPSADASRAGSLAGEGRMRPGRQDPVPDPEDNGDTEPDPDRSEAGDAPEPSRNDAVPVEQGVVRPGPAPEPVLEILPLGSGLILIGLGLGLAFLALRVRRG
ncbi:hypothetical protein [Streptomyces sp. NPDC001530]|uniref:hypothetical protein n=1 Tax=Streptomyces sp. NPDC001530 TaxID=3364582 RepID=UPI00367A1D67